MKTFDDSFQDPWLLFVFLKDHFRQIMDYYGVNMNGPWGSILGVVVVTLTGIYWMAAKFAGLQCKPAFEGIHQEKG